MAEREREREREIEKSHKEPKRDECQIFIIDYIIVRCTGEREVFV